MRRRGFLAAALAVPLAPFVVPKPQPTAADFEDFLRHAMQWGDSPKTIIMSPRQYELLGGDLSLVEVLE